MFYRLKQLILLTGDILALYAGLYLGVALRYTQWPNANFINLIAPLTFLFSFAIVILFIIGFYDIGRARTNSAFFQKIIAAASVWLVISILYFYTSPNVTVSPKTTLLLVTICGFGALTLWRTIYNHFLSGSFLGTPVIFVGFNNEIEELADVMMKVPERGYTVSGLVTNINTGLNLPTADTLEELVKKNRGAYPGLIIISEQAKSDTALLNSLYRALYQQASIIPLADFYENFFKKIPPYTFSEDWFVTHLNEQTRKIYDRFRILIDVFFAALMGIIFAVIFPLVAVIIKLTSPGPIFFSQLRVGRTGMKFKIYKFRTMHALGQGGSAELGGAQYATINDARITKFGTFLRRTRLDELPQFINILKGEMAVIGPRPERPEFVDQLTAKMPFYSLRHLVKPGITGWAQLQKSYYGTLEENLVKLEYDLYYIKNRSPLLDAVIILRTFEVLLRMMGR